MNKLKTLILIVCVFAWSCESTSEIEPEVQQVQTGISFWVDQGESVYLSSADIYLSNIELEGWHPEGFVGPMSTARITIGEANETRQISILHRLRCEYEFNGKEEVCQRDDAFFARLDELSGSHSNTEMDAYQEVAPLGNGLKLYMLLVTPEEVNGHSDFVSVKSAEFLIRKD